MKISKVYSAMLATCLYFGCNGAASACEEFVRLETEQLAMLETQIQNNENPLQQLTAFRTLSCSDDPGIRDLAIRTGLMSSNQSMRTSALHLNILSKNSLVIDMMEETEHLTEEQYDFMFNNPRIIMQVSSRDFENSCLGLAYDNCAPNFNLRLSGQTVVIVLSGLEASFSLNSEGRLIGVAKQGRDNPTVPAELILF